MWHKLLATRRGRFLLNIALWGVSAAMAYAIFLALGARPSILLFCIVLIIFLGMFAMVRTYCLPPFSRGALRPDGKAFERKDRVLAVMVFIVAALLLALVGWVAYMFLVDYGFHK